MITASIIIVWIASGIFAAGKMNAYWRDKYPSLYRDREYCKNSLHGGFLLNILFGPVGAGMAVWWCWSRGSGWTLSTEPVALGYKK